MFETAEVGRAVTKEKFDEAVPALRAEMVEVQQQLRRSDFPVIVLFAGVDGAGKSETINLLNAWMDPRWIVTRAYPAPSEEERERPKFWRFWRELPPHGSIALLLSAWYSRPILDRVFKTSKLSDFDRSLDRILAFEKLLADDGALILKFWMHLGRSQQKKRLRALEKDPLLSWRVTKRDWEHWKLYDRFISTAEHALMRTSTGYAPWKIVEGTDHAYRSLAVTTILRDAIRKHVRTNPEAAAYSGEEQPSIAGEAVEISDAVELSLETARQRTVLDGLDMTLMVSKRDYAVDLPKAQGRLNRLARQAKAEGVSTVLAFEGSDAAGKGGAIRRIVQALDARDTQVYPIGAPSDEERVRNHLWRFWRRLPRAGRVTIFDRTWYGRVLVERVEGFATEAEWMRAYAEINNFEQELVEHGIVLVKFWLHITPDEQLRRFTEREKVSYKRWKLTDEDWRNREKWDQYERAVHEMVERTSTTIAPWVLVEGNSKRFARLKVLQTVADAIEGVIQARDDVK